MGVFAKNHVVVTGRQAGPTVMLSHGFVRDQIPDAGLVTLDAVGHCPQPNAPEAPVQAISDFVTGLR